jgi:hypothetical protein
MQSMTVTTRVLVILGLVAAAGIGAMAQTARDGRFPSNDAVNEGGTYRASLCADKVWLPSAAYGTGFYMHVTKRLNSDWFEAEVGPLPYPADSKMTSPVEIIRINQTSLCYVKPLGQG